VRRGAAGRLGAVVAGTLFVAACLSKPAIVSRSFSIDPPAPRTSIPPTGLVLALARVDVAPPYSGQRLVYQVAENEFELDPYAKFVAPPSWLLTVAIQGYLSNADFVRDVTVSGRGGRPDAIVEVAVRQLAGELGPGGPSSILALRIRVIPEEAGGRRRSAILLKDYTKTIHVSRATASDVVHGWSQGLAEIMAEFEADFRAAWTESKESTSSDSPRVPGTKSDP